VKQGREKLYAVQHYQVFHPNTLSDSANAEWIVEAPNPISPNIFFPSELFSPDGFLSAEA
jgi:hypothetical protein